MAQRACITYRWTYDVFLSFRGEDTRLNFVGHLYDSLRKSGIHGFIDDESLQAGEEIKPSLFKAIRESRIAIIVFSKNYASSTFCLEELAEIMECFKGEGRLVYPVFYHVDPSEVRHQRGGYGEALLYLQRRLQNKEYKLPKWRLALSEAANLSGWHLKPGIAKEQEYIRRITCEVSTKINRTPLHVNNYPVGLVPRVQEVMSLLDLWSNKEVNMVGICGIGGSGKSTIARSLYNSVADHFDGLCFLSNVRETSNKHGLPHLQETLLCKLVKEKDLKLEDFYEGISIIEHRLCRKKILLVIDDVDKLGQLQALAGSCDWFGSGSRIIITTRDKHLLVCHGVERIYDVKELNDEEALQLFSWYAFKKENMDSSYLDVSKHAILYSCGLPLALEVIGSNLCGKRIDEWKSALDEYQRIPNKNVFEVLKLSYDALEDREKDIFLDLACFFKGEKLDVIKMLLSFRGLCPEYIIGVLMDKSLIKIEENRVTMHDLIEHMGKEIVRQKSPKEPGKRDRLWFYDDILHVLQENTGSDEIEAIILDLPEDKEVQWSGEAFKNMKNLKMLVIKNASFSTSPVYLPNTLRVLEWRGYTSEFFPSNFHPTKLIRLDLSNSSIELLQPFNKKFESLSCMNFRNCKFLRQIPNLSGVSNLVELWLDNCTNLTEIHDSVGFLDKLREFSAMRCKNLRTLPTGIKLTSLEHLNFYGCSSLQSFPEILDEMRKIRTIDLDKSAIEELPSSVCNLIGLESLNMDECHNLKQLPAVICMMPNLWTITANFCEGLRHFIKMHESEREANSVMSTKLEHVCFSNCNLSNASLDFCLFYFPNLIQLDLSSNNFTTLPASIKECHRLKYLSLDNCNMLQHIEGMPPNLEKFSALYCTLLSEPSRGMVLNQAIYQYPGKRNFILPGKNIPEWLDKYSYGNSLSFWVRNELPTIYMWILIKDDDQVSLCDDCKFSVRVNDTVQEISSGWLSLSTMKTYHIYLSDLQSIVRKVQLSHMDRWNHVKFSIENNRTQQEMRSKREIYFAVHVYKQGNYVENIEFMNPKACINYYPWKLIQQPEDLEQVEDAMNQDSKSTNSAEFTQNCTSYQDIGPNLWSISKFSERKVGRNSLIRSKHNGILKKIRRWQEDHSMILESNYLTAMAVTAHRLIESLESMHLNKEDQEYNFLLMNDHKIQTAKEQLKVEFRKLLVQNRHPFEHSSIPSSSGEFQRDSSVSRESEKHNIIVLVSPELLQHITCIANLMFALDYGRECYNNYTNVRRHALNECLFHLEKERLSTDNVSRMEWDGLNSKSKAWIYQAKIFVRVYLARERWLSDQIFGDSTEASLTCFIGASKASILRLLNLCEAISFGSHKPERIFRFLDMYQALADLIPDLDALYSEHEVSSPVRIKCQAVLNRLDACVRSIFLEFKNVIALSPPRSRVPGGGIHPLTYYVMSYIGYLFDYQKTLNILNDEDEEDDDDISLSPERSHDTSKDSASSVMIHFRSVTSILESNLYDKSNLYNEAACQHLFLMNNLHYMAQRVQESELKHIFGDEWIRECICKYEEHARNYEQASWSSLLSLLKDEEIQISCKLSENLLKNRLRSFYLAFENIYRIQTAWVIPDPQLREAIQNSISQKLVHAYRTFLGKYYSYIGGKHITYDISDFETSLLDFFGGSQKSWPLHPLTLRRR